MKDEIKVLGMYSDITARGYRMTIRQLDRNKHFKEVPGRPNIITNTCKNFKQGVEFIKIFQGTEAECKQVRATIASGLEAQGYTRLNVSDVAA